MSNRKESLRTKSFNKTESSVDVVKVDDSSTTSRQTQIKKKEEKPKLAAAEKEDPYGLPPVLRDETKWDGSGIADAPDIPPVSTLTLEEGVDVKPGVSYETLEQRNIIVSGGTGGPFQGGKKPLKRLQKSFSGHEFLLNNLMAGNAKQLPGGGDKPKVSSILSMINSKKKAFTDQVRMNSGQIKYNVTSSNAVATITASRNNVFLNNAMSVTSSAINDHRSTAESNSNSDSSSSAGKLNSGPTKEKSNDDHKVKTNVILF